MRRLFGWTLVALALALGGCPGGGESGTPAGGSGGAGADGGGTLIYARGADSEYLDPPRVTDGESVKVLTNLYETLVAFEPGSLETRPGLAESWEVSDDGLTWTFQLREARFHDGTDLDADAVVWSFRRQMDKDHPAHTSDMSYWTSIFAGTVKDIRKVDDRTVAIELSAAFAPFEASMTLFSMAIVSPAAYGNADKPLERNPVGTGPFKFVRWAKGEVIVLERFDDYWGEKAGVKKLMFKVIAENSQRVIALENGRADIADNINPQDHERVAEHADLDLVQAPGLNMAYLAMNCMKPPFDDVRVRQAVAFALSKEKIRQSAYDGRGDLATVPCPPGMPGRIDIEDRKQDAAKAKALLADAGHANGLEIELWFGTAARPYMPDAAAVAIQVQQDLAQIGIKAKPVKIEWNQFLDDTKNGKHAMCLLGWSADYGDIDNFLYVLLDKSSAVVGQSNNVAFYRDEDTSALLHAARSENDKAKRWELYADAQKRLFEHAPMIPFMHMPDSRAVSKRVKGYVLYPAGGEFLRHCSVD